MTEYHLCRDGRIIGTFNYNEIIRGLNKHTFNMSDYYWKAGMTDWRLLRDFKVHERPINSPKLSHPFGKTMRTIFVFTTESLAWIAINILGPILSALIKIMGKVFLGLIVGLLSGISSGGRKSGRRRRRDRDESYDNGD